MNQKDILKKLVGFNTINDRDNQQIMNWLSDFLRPLGFDIQVFTDKENGKKMILAKTKQEPILGFLCHTDTVSDSDGWDFNPFSLTEKNEELYGLGVCDMKGGIAACLSAISQLDMNKSRRGLEILFTYDEEVDFSGIKNFIEFGKFKAKYIIVPEPTGLVPMLAAKGCVSFKTTFNGVSAHGSEPERGENAILSACEFIPKFKNFFENKIKPETSLAFPGAFASYNIAKIVGGDVINKVPDKCTLEIECRTIKLGQNEKIYNGILEIISNMKAVSQMSFSLPCFSTKNDNFLAFFEEATGKVASFANYTTEANFFSGRQDFVVIGPGPVTAHEKNEHISKKSLEKLVDVYKKAINRYCF